MTEDLARADERRPLESEHEPAGPPEMYVYEPAGIREYSGSVPMWLKLVALGLIVWGIYYTIRYWSGD
ncbi:cbb3-type cytochrome c oxidase N-terminal domain-containing protein [Candidatus Nitrospira bockiana]